ncbi:DUF2273 domain-containing protein [Longirhabdus pacifica]|uniref:DUF2273 domain-containing protein n=1 Tax=Longirhabdus pacifica TaxID=2305227 RepID=UPI00100910F9|nr:DUF2273 domain-containing protein [Longirhabdus pacifica]
MFRDLFRDLWDNHRGKSIGLIMGIIFGIIYLFAGFWKTLLFVLIVLLCFFAGKNIDNKEPILHFDKVVGWIADRFNGFR